MVLVWSKSMAPSVGERLIAAGGRVVEYDMRGGFHRK